MRLAGAAGALVLLGACNAAGPPSLHIPTNGAPTTAAGVPGYAVHVQSVSGVGQVLVNGYDLTLYVFAPDAVKGQSTCYKTCATQWPPLVLPAGVTAPVASGGVNSALLGTSRRSDGTLQVTFDGWPLYRFLGDTAPGEATGEALDNDGGLWYAIGPSGAPLR